MNFVDSSLISLADSVSRNQFFTSANLEAIGGVAFDTDAMGLGAPFSAIFDNLTFGVPSVTTARVDGQVGLSSAAERQTVTIGITGLSAQTTIWIDALWRGAIVARAGTSITPIDTAFFQWTDESIDSQIISDLGALPAEPQLETERRTRLVARLKAEAHTADAISDATIGQVLSSMGAASVGELLTRRRGTQGIGVGTVGFAAAQVAPDTPRIMPFAGAILIRDAGFSLAQLLMESSQIQQQLKRDGFEVQADSWIVKRRPFTLVWVIPLATFDDTGWPGANANERISRASAWLANQGIALVAK